MSILIPKFNLVTWASLTAFFVLCLFEGGEPNPELSHAVLGLAVLGSVAALGVKAAYDKNKRQKEAIAATADFEAGRKQDITDAYKASVDPAQARLTKDDYGPSDASMRDQHEDVARAVAAQDRFDRAALEQERQGPYGPGTKFDLSAELAKRRLNTLASSKLGIQRGGDMAGRRPRHPTFNSQPRTVMFLVAWAQMLRTCSTALPECGSVYLPGLLRRVRH